MAWATGANHLVVILDTSKSMSESLPEYDPNTPYDPGKLSVLATIMLSDLAEIKPANNGDSFAILPFEKSYDGTQESNAQPIRYRGGARTEFVDEVRNLQFDSENTFFYPSVKRAISELKSTKNAHDDSRTIVLITDGVSDDALLGKDAVSVIGMGDYQRLEGLKPQLQSNNIKLYVLTFGQGYENQAFFNSIVENPNSDIHAIPTTDDLMKKMLEIFTNRFGYENRHYGVVKQRDSLDLNAGLQPSRVAVIDYSDEKTAPAFNLTPPQGGNFRHDGFLRAKVLGGSYSLVWVRQPNEKTYAFEPQDGSLEHRVAVLIPVNMEIVVEDAATGETKESFDETMAKQKMRVPFLVNAKNGGTLDESIDFSYDIYGPGGKPSEWEALERTQSATGQPTQTVQNIPSKQYEIKFTFPDNNTHAQQEYKAKIHAKVKSRDKIVGELPTPHIITVYPFLSIAPDLKVRRVPDTLTEGEQRCVNLTLEKKAGFFHDDLEATGISARVSIDKTRDYLNYELYGMEFTLDGEPLPIDGKDLLTGKWVDKGFLSEEDLLNEHEFCLKVGRPRARFGVPSSTDLFDNDIDLMLEMVFNHPAYSKFDVISPFTAKIRLQSPPSIWHSLFKLLFFLFLLLAILWYTRNKPKLDPDLFYSLTPIDDDKSGTNDFGQSGSIIRRSGVNNAVTTMLGRVQSHEIVEPGPDGARLGYFRPLHDSLFSIQFINDVVFSGEYLLKNEVGLASSTTANGNKEVLPSSRTSPRGQRVWIKANKPYKLTAGGQKYQFYVTYKHGDDGEDTDESTGKGGE